MKKQNLIILTVIAVLGLILSIYLMLSPLLTNSPDPLVGENKNCGSYSYDNCPTDCVVCPPCAACSSISCQTKEFCKSIGFNDSWYTDMNPKKTYCTPEQKSAEVCPEYYSATCGWFNQTIKCLKYPCAETFSNPCFACAGANVEYYTSGECPK